MSPFDYNGLNKQSNNRNTELGFDEVFLDHQKDDSHVLDDEKATINYRLLGLGLLLAFAVLFGRLYVLQAVNGEDYRLQAEGNKSRRQYIIAPRGLITDQAGQVIVGNVPSFELVVVPGDLPPDEQVLDYKLSELAALLEKDKQEFYDLIGKMNRSSFQPQTLAQNISKDAALSILAQESEYVGFGVQNNPIRDYKEPLVYAHLTGYTGKINEQEYADRDDQNYLLNDYIGKTGLEQTYEEFLRGVPGEKPVEVDAQGNFIKNLPQIDPQPGNNVKLNIDSELQKVLYDELTSMMERYKKTRASAVITNPQTGQVLAYFSLPGFDSNMFARGISNPEYQKLLNDPDIPLLNRPITGTYPPGSTVKPMLAQAALTEGIVTPKTIIVDDGVIRVGSYTYYGYNRSGLGPMDVYSAIARSSDIYFYTVGGGNAKTNIKEGLGPERLAKWYREFNLGKILGIDLPNEKPGLVPDPDWKLATRDEPWFLGNTYHVSIGQGDLLVTPLQVNSWIATLGNGGKIMKPYIVDEVITQGGELVHKNQPEVLKQDFLDPQWLDVVQEAMRQTSNIGSAQLFKSLDLPVSGKTGTAQTLNNNFTQLHAWFSSYAPSDNPEIAITIMVEEGGEGGVIPLYTSHAVYEWWQENRWSK